MTRVIARALVDFPAPIPPVLITRLNASVTTPGGRIESIPQAGHHSNTRTNKQLNRDDWGHTKLLSRGD